MLTLYIILLLLIAYFWVISLCDNDTFLFYIIEALLIICVISLFDDDTLLFYIIEVLFIVGMLRIRTLTRSYFVNKNKHVFWSEGDRIKLVSTFKNPAGIFYRGTIFKVIKVYRSTTNTIEKFTIQRENVPPVEQPITITATETMYHHFSNITENL